MMEFFEALFAIIIVGWCLARIFLLFLKPIIAVFVGYLFAIVVLLLLRETSPILMFFAIFSPIGVVLPAIAIQNSLKTIGFQFVQFSRIEIATVFVLFLAYILASIGFVNWDPYRYGYSAVGVGIVSITISTYCFIRGHIVLLAAIFISQILWYLEIGSSNYYDNIGNMLLIPILPLVLLTGKIVKS